MTNKTKTYIINDTYFIIAKNLQQLKQIINKYSFYFTDECEVEEVPQNTFLSFYKELY